MRYTQIDEVGQILRKIRSPSGVVNVLPGIYLIPGLAECPETRFAICSWSIWSCQQKLGLCILCFDLYVCIKVLRSSV